MERIQQRDVESKSGNMPEKKFRAGTVSATVWQNEGKSKDGDSYVYKSVSVQKSYKDREGKWQITNSLRVNDLPKVAAVVQKAYEYIIFSSEKSQEAVI